jgi:hypothetical protein
MVAKFQTGASIRNTLNYNEKKVQKGVAELLSAVNYPLSHDRLSFDHKLYMLLHRASLNENVTANSVHISLNFGAEDTLDNEQLAEIASLYMDKIGFGNQPYLVYRHHDAGHLHTHIVTVKIGADGRRLETQNIGKNQSRQACEEIEKMFDLTRTNDNTVEQKTTLEPINAQRVKYGKTETKRAISNVLRSVLDSYIFTSLPELNALLRLYNVEADRGSETSKTYRHNGLLYHVLDEHGKRIGIPIKASLFYMKPTWDSLKKRFEKNAALKEPLKRRVENVVDMALVRQPKITLAALAKELEKEGVSMVLRQNESGRVYGITYIDHKQKVVFNGSDLGKPYSANGMVERCKAPEQQATKAKEQRLNMENGRPPVQRSIAPPDNSDFPEGGLIGNLLQQEYTGETLPYDLRKKRKKKRRNISDNQ